MKRLKVSGEGGYLQVLPPVLINLLAIAQPPIHYVELHIIFHEIIYKPKDEIGAQKHHKVPIARNAGFVTIEKVIPDLLTAIGREMNHTDYKFQ